MSPCGICGRPIDGHDADRRANGDFHRTCFNGLSGAGLGVKNCREDDAKCRICNERIAKGMPMLEFLGMDGVAHLSCFFGAPDGRTNSVGARAWRPSLVEIGRALRAHSGALRAVSRRLIEAHNVWGLDRRQPLFEIFSRNDRVGLGRQTKSDEPPRAHFRDAPAGRPSPSFQR